MSPPDVREAMRARVRRHLTWSLLGIVVAVGVGAAIAGGLASVVAETAQTPVAMAGVFVPMLGAVAFGFWSTFRNLRCPACDQSVWLHVSWRMSVFGSRSEHCEHCGARLFGESSNLE